MIFKVFVLCFILKIVSGSKLIRNEDDNDKFCYATSEFQPQHKQFATKTAYEKIKGSLTDHVNIDDGN